MSSGSIMRSCKDMLWRGNVLLSMGAPPTPTPPTPTPTPPTTPGTSVYVTYHNYYTGQSLLSVSCSDGTNGLISRWGYTTINPMAHLCNGNIRQSAESS